MKIWRITIGAGLLATIIAFIGTYFYMQNKRKPLYNAEYTVETGITRGNVQSDIIAGLLEKRLKQLELNFKIKQISSKQLLVSIKKISDTLLSKNLLTGNGKVEFWETYSIEELAGLLERINKLYQQQLIDEYDTPEPDSMDLLGNPEDKIRWEINNYTLINFLNTTGNGMLGSIKLKDTAAFLQFLLLQEKNRNISPGVKFLFGYDPILDRGDSLIYLYAIKNHWDPGVAPISNEDVESCFADYGYEGSPMLSLKFNERGMLRWAKLTRENIGKFVALTYNQQVISAPRVADEIIGGRTTVTGDFTIEECQLMSALISSDELPTGIRILSSDIKEVNPLSSPRFVFIPLLAFAVFSAIAYVLVKVLKAT